MLSKKTTPFLEGRGGKRARALRPFSGRSEKQTRDGLLSNVEKRAGEGAEFEEKRSNGHR